MKITNLTKVHQDLCQKKKKAGKIDNLAKFPQTPISHIQCIRVQKSDEFDDNGQFDEILRELKVRMNQLSKGHHKNDEIDNSG